MSKFIVQNRHDAAKCDDAFDALERAVAESSVSVRDDTLLCTCPHGTHGGSLIVEADGPDAAESIADRWDVGETTVSQLTEMEVG